MRNRYILFGDVFLIAVAAFGAFFLRLNWFFPSYREAFIGFLVAAVLVKPVSFYLFGLYSRFWRYASVQDLFAVLLGVSAATVGMVVVVFLGLVANLLPGFPRSVVFIDWLLTFICIGGLRISVRVVFESAAKKAAIDPDRAEKRILVVGAGEAGMLVARELQRNPQLGMTPIGFLDDERVKVGKRIQGLPVLAMLESLSDVVAEHRVNEVIIAMPTAPGRMLREVAESCRRAGVKSRTVPGLFELLDGNVSVSRLRPIEIADLLRRDSVAVKDDTATYLAGRTVLVTGAGGSIGFELCRQIARAKPSNLVLLGHGENSIFDAEAALRATFPDLRLHAVIADIRDRGRIDRVFDRFRPTIVFHAAAHKHVPLMEENPEEAVTNNVVGTANIARAAHRVDTERLVLISSDKAVSPSSMMGASKRMAERVVHDAARRYSRAFIVVRFGNVLGSRGSVVPVFQQQIAAGGPITITHPDMKRYFMTIPEAVHLVLQAGRIGRGGELFVLDMGVPVRIADLATDLIRLSGLSEDEIPVVVTGVRPGEKLEETLWERGSTVKETVHSQIMQVFEHDESGTDRTEQSVGALEAAAEQGDRLAIAAILAECIATFAPPVPRARS
jgi:FlaA1/EpsC-like NDP-sugar epimerase